jgi:hypothetical protein
MKDGSNEGRCNFGGIGYGGRKLDERELLGV